MTKDNTGGKGLFWNWTEEEVAAFAKELEAEEQQTTKDKKTNETNTNPNQSSRVS